MRKVEFDSSKFGDVTSSHGKWSRRDFLKGALVVSAGATTAGLAACAPTSALTSDSAQSGQLGSAAQQESPTATASARPWEGSAPKIAEDRITETINTDVVVVGAGVAGMNAAAGASGEGAKVVVLEKAATFSARGMDNGAIGSKLQKEHGIVIDPAEVLKYETQWDHGKLNQNLFKVWLYRSGEMFDEIIDLVADAGYTSGFASGVMGGREDLEPYYRMYQTNHGFAQSPEKLDADGKPIDAQHVYVGILEEFALKHGADIRYSTPAVQLIKDASGAITGVIARKEDGDYIQVNADKGVILATGDISGNKEMVKEFCPMTLHNLGNGSGVVDAYMPQGCNTGDAITMGAWVGAVPQIAPAAPMVHGFGFQMGFGAHAVGWLQVNREGDRYHDEEPNEVSNANAMMLQPGAQGWWLFDGGYADKVLKMVPDNAGFGGTPMIDDSTAGMLEQAVESGQVLKADTLDELANKIGCPAASLKATIERYNQVCANGVDDDFAKRSVWLQGTSIDTAPYYAANIMGMWFVTIYGLHCNAYSQVLNADDNPIPNLFAVGNAQGDFFTDDYPLLTPGISHGRAAVFGRLVGKALAKGKLYSLTPEV
ncbi:MAG: FAD-dependent oxidoreductase [Coriobacteriales bacterium]|nr:FAD-dependent oxidoreductase [Coriobacteriales bacterium]